MSISRVSWTSDEACIGDDVDDAGLSLRMELMDWAGRSHQYDVERGEVRLRIIHKTSSTMRSIPRSFEVSGAYLSLYVNPDSKKLAMSDSAS